MGEILVTGGAGFIGAHLTRRLVERGELVTVVSAGTTRTRSVLPPAVRHFEVDIRDRSAIVDRLSNQRFEKVFNLAGYIDHTPFFKGGRAVLDQHFTAVQNLLEAVDRRSLKSFVQIGSSDEYGNAPSPQREDLREDPIAPYSLGKTAATHLIQMLSKTEGFPGVVVRLFLTYGPGQDDRRFIPQIINGCLQNRKFDTSEGRQLRDFCYIDDIIDGLIAASDEKRAVGHVINLASGQPVPVKDVVSQIVSACGGGEPVFGAIPYRPGENMSLYADVTKAKAILDWTSRTSLAEGIERTVRSFRANAALKTP